MNLMYFERSIGTKLKEKKSNLIIRQSSIYKKYIITNCHEIFPNDNTACLYCQWFVKNLRCSVSRNITGTELKTELQ